MENDSVFLQPTKGSEQEHLRRTVWNHVRILKEELTEEYHKIPRKVSGTKCGIRVRFKVQNIYSN
jgi:hypothetical protein